MFSKLINWVKGKPSNKQPEFHQNYPHSEPLDELIEYLLNHKDECQVLDNDGYWITIALDRIVVIAWVTNYPFAALNDVRVFDRLIYEAAKNHNKWEVSEMYSSHPKNVLWSIEDKVPSPQNVIDFYNTFYPEMINRGNKRIYSTDDHAQLIAVLNDVTVSLNEKRKKSKLTVDKNEQPMDNNQSRRIDRNCDNDSTVEGVDHESQSLIDRNTNSSRQ